MKKCQCDLLISDNIKLKIKSITTNKMDNFIMKEWSVNQENIILNVHVHFNQALRYRGKHLTRLKGPRHKSPNHN